ncbi:MAG: hypothetical protein M3Z24_13095, partial [Chloroflexota bacterium]|nr:hypothetical protein [Chloroflexota bacterium]
MNLWHINEDRFDPQKLNVEETVYTIGNGYFGTRGSFEEGYPHSTPATLLYGVFDDIAIGKEELANVPDWVLLKLFVNGVRFRLDRGTILGYSRTLDMYNGILSRSVHWETPEGIRIRMKCERFASLADEHFGAIRYSVTVEENPTPVGEMSSEPVDIALWATLSTAVGNYDLMHWETVTEGREDDLLWLHTQTRHSGVQLVQTMSFTTQNEGFHKEMMISDIAPNIRLLGKLAPGETVTGEKIVGMYTSRDTRDLLHVALERHRTITQSQNIHHAGDSRMTPDPMAEAEVCSCVYDALLDKHKEAWHQFWQVSDIIIEGDDRSQQAVRYNLYQLRISASTHDSRYSIAAKGLTGFGYRGHVFHDTEIFMVPFFTYVLPGIASNLLLYRYHLLPAARDKAAKNGYEGAQFPWESTIDGKEATPGAIVHPESGELIAVLNGKIELHITASIAFSY